MMKRCTLCGIPADDHTAQVKDSRDPHRLRLSPPLSPPKHCDDCGDPIYGKGIFQRSTRRWWHAGCYPEPLPERAAYIKMPPTG